MFAKKLINPSPLQAAQNYLTEQTYFNDLGQKRNSELPVIISIEGQNWYTCTLVCLHTILKKSCQEKFLRSLKKSLRDRGSGVPNPSNAGHLEVK